MTTKFVYYDPRLLEEDMPEADPHARLARYLVSLLEWIYKEQVWYISDNLLIKSDTERIDIAISPDIAVFKNLLEPIPATPALKSWRVGEFNRPVPAVVFEIASESTWNEDLNAKISLYQQLGVQEYFTYDPNTPAYWGANGSRLRGWRYSNGLTQELQMTLGGWMWSSELGAGLLPGGALLRLCNEKGVIYLTEAETERQSRLVAEQNMQQERVAREIEQKNRLEAERKVQELEARLRELEKGQAEA